MFVLPGNKVKNQVDNNQIEQNFNAETQKMHEQAFLGELKDNVLSLFDPIKLDNLTKKNTKLEKQQDFIKKTEDSITVKQQKQIKTDSSQSGKTDLKISKLKKDLLMKQAPLIFPKPDPKIKALQERYNKKNKEQLLAIEKEQKFFKTNGKFSFMINVFSDEKKAIQYINQMKGQYPLWSFLLKANKDHIRVYLGPFPSKKLAQEFKDSLSNPTPFSSLEFLEEFSIN
ncbi:MAG: SPOR domain-containing protein [Bdellovibrionaceae bacterium]|nr:SPOR domain-containing protein [Pseudobdellovibrionaceae bacterium]